MPRAAAGRTTFDRVVSLFWGCATHFFVLFFFSLSFFFFLPLRATKARFATGSRCKPASHIMAIGAATFEPPPELFDHHEIAYCRVRQPRAEGLHEKGVVAAHLPGPESGIERLPRQLSVNLRSCPAVPLLPASRSLRRSNEPSAPPCRHLYDTPTSLPEVYDRDVFGSGDGRMLSGTDNSRACRLKV